MSERKRKRERGWGGGEREKNDYGLLTIFHESDEL